MDPEDLRQRARHLRQLASLIPDDQAYSPALSPAPEYETQADRAFRSDVSARAILIDRRSLLKHTTAAMAVLVILSCTSVAQAAGASDPTGPIRQLDAALLAAMKAGQATPFRQRYAMLAPAVEHAFDLNAVLQAAVGPSWNSLPLDQRAALASTFQRYTICNYTANFDSYDGQSFRVLPQTQARADGNITVRTQIIRRDRSTVEIDYVMRQTALGWKTVDVLADGTISQVAVQRSDFHSLLATGGVPALQAGLQRKVATLSNGALR